MHAYDNDRTKDWTGKPEENNQSEGDHSTTSSASTPAAASATSGVDVPVAFPLAAALFFFFFLFLDEETCGRVRISCPVSVILLVSVRSHVRKRRDLQDGLFELGGVSSVEGYCGPIVSPMVEVGGTEVDHWFLTSANPTQRGLKLTIVKTCPASIRPGVLDPP